MISLLSNLKFLLNPKVLIGLGVAAIGVYIWYLHSEIGGYQEEITRYQEIIELKNAQILQIDSLNEELSNTIKQYTQDLSEQTQARKELEQQNADLNKELRIKVTDIERAKGRQDIVWQRPTLVEKLLRRSWEDFVNQVSCESGATEKCEQ